MPDALPGPAATATAMITAIAILAAFKIIQRKIVRRELARRVRYTILPATSFAPSPEDILRFARQLARTRPASRLRPQRACGVRVRMHTGDRAKLTYEISGPRHAESLLRHEAYPQTEIRKVDPWEESPSGETSPPGGGEEPPSREEAPREEKSPPGTPAGRDDSPPAIHVVREELVLAADSRMALRDTGLKPDPLQGFAAALRDIRAYLSESAEICLDLVPLTPARVAHLRRRHSRPGRAGGHTMAGIASTIGSELGDLALEFAGEVVPAKGGAARPTRAAGPRPQAQPADPGKFGETGQPMFTAQLLIKVTSRSRERAAGIKQEIRAAFDAWSGDNYWREAGINLGVAHIGAGSVLFRRRFDKRIATGEFRPRRTNLVTAGEIAGLLKPPTRHCAHDNVARSGGTVPPAPLDLPVWTGQRDVIPLGYATAPDGLERLLGMRLDELTFSLAVGKSGFGKTEKALCMAVAMALAGHGLWFLDPHADGWRRVQPMLTEPQVASRLWEIDLTVRSADARIAGYNPLAMTGLDRIHIAERIQAVVTAFAAALSWGDAAPRAKTILTKACETLCYLSLRLPAEATPTLFQIRTLLDDPEWREVVLPALPRPLRAYWTGTFSRLPDNATPVITNLIEQLSSSPTLAAFFGSPAPSYDVRKAMDTGRVVFICPPGDDIGRVASCLLIYDLFRAGRSRADIPAGQRRRFEAFIDELTAVDGAARGYLAGILEQLRKYGVRLHAMTQMIQRLTPATRDAFLQNQTLLATTACEIDAARHITRQWGGRVEPETLLTLPKYHHVLTSTAGGQATTPFKVRGAEVTELFAEHHKPQLLGAQREAIDSNLERRPINEILSHLDTLDDRIIQALDNAAPSEGTGSGPAQEARRTRRGDGHVIDISHMAQERGQ